MSAPKTAITPTREENYPEWYQQVVKHAHLAEISPVRGCMVIKPWGYAIWENIQKDLDARIKATGHKNAYFPLFIPLSYLQKEAQHVEGFAKECAVVTHHRLKQNEDGKLVPDGELEEPLIVRPTSETIIGETFSRWIQSYRDLPLLINQWANVVRWEMRTRLFLRTCEFLWQEGHTAHATVEEAQEETEKMLHIYESFCREMLAIPMIVGEKSANERFPGALSTYTIEAMMQDKKALQAGTSHNLGQNFAKAAEIKFNDIDGSQKYCYTTSWGMTTRLIGGLVMTHSDDDGLVLPPKVAPAHIVIIPILHKSESSQRVLDYCYALKHALSSIQYGNRNLEVEIDTRDERGGDKIWSWIKKGVPLRIEVGPRDVEEDKVCVARRDQPHKNKSFLLKQEFLSQVVSTLDQIQQGLYTKASSFLEKNIRNIHSKEEFYNFFEGDEEHAPGFALCHFCQDSQLEEEIKQNLKVTLRCLPLNEKDKPGTCIFTGKPSPQKVIFAKSY